MLAKSANLNLVRVHGHVAHPYLYQQADELGMLLFQDFPLNGATRVQFETKRRGKRPLSSTNSDIILQSFYGTHTMNRFPTTASLDRLKMN